MNSIVSLDLVGLLPVSRNPIIDNIVLSCTRNFLFLEIFNLQIGKQSIVYLRQGFIKLSWALAPTLAPRWGVERESVQGMGKEQEQDSQEAPAYVPEPSRVDPVAVPVRCGLDFGMQDINLW